MEHMLSDSRRLWLLCAILGTLLIYSRASFDDGGVEPSSFYYSDFQEDLQDLRLLGDAKFVRIDGQVDGMAVQLSGTRKNTVGRLLYGIPINMLDVTTGKSTSFSTYFTFSMAAWAGDGMAFVVVPDKTTIGASGPWLGLVRQDEISKALAPNTFAVEFDSVMNEELRDPNSNHVGIDVETIVSDVTGNASDISVVLNDGSKTHAWIDYDGETNTLEVRISKSESKPAAAFLSHKINLSKIWKPWMFVGFSSSAGEASQKHKVFSWRFWSGTKKSKLNGMHSMPLDPYSIAPSQHKTFLDPSVWISLLVGFTCGATVTVFLLAGWFIMRRKREDGYEAI